MTKYKMTPKVKELTFGTDGARKRDFVFSTVSRPVKDTASYWDGGSRDYYKVVNIDTGATLVPPQGTYPTFKADYTMRSGDVIIQTGIFQGKPFTPYIFCLAADETRVRVWLGIPYTA